MRYLSAKPAESSERADKSLLWAMKSIYLSEKTPVYSRDGAYLLYGYYAVEIRKGA